MRGGLHDVSCAIHVHSRFSDGTATIPEIVEAARASHRDVVVVTDHDSMEARRRGYEGWHDAVLLLVGEELSPSGGHYLAFGLEDELGGSLTEAEIPAAVAAAGGFGFAAHPFSTGSRISRAIAPPRPWARLEDPAITGLELWSLQTDVAESWASPLEAWRSFSDPERWVEGPPDGHLRRWDQLCASRRMVGIGGLDAHQKGLRLLGRPLSPMSNERWFGMLGTHVLCRRPLLGDLARDRAEIFAALRGGRCYVCRDSLGNPTGFDFRASGRGGTLLMGEQGEPGAWTLTVSLPREARISLLRDGEAVARASGRGLERRIEEPGAYRVEVALQPGGRPRRWLISNPIYLR
jgi:PHP domain